MDDLTTYALLATSFFFVAVAIVLLAKYRQVSQRINTSTDLGRDLWQSLEQRLKRQDERILDVMGRLEVVQARVLAAAAPPSPPASVAAPLPPEGVPSAAPEVRAEHIARPLLPLQQPTSPESRDAQIPLLSQAPTEAAKSEVKLDETQLTAIKLLSDGPKNTRQLTDALNKSREHTARIMKGLFESGFVKRNDSSKPFVYELTDGGRRALASASQPETGPSQNSP